MSDSKGTHGSTAIFPISQLFANVVSLASDHMQIRSRELTQNFKTLLNKDAGHIIPTVCYVTATKEVPRAAKTDMCWEIVK